MLSATKKARRNIKLLEEADHDAINKVGEPRFKKILTEQEKQLHHYLAQYTDPNYLPKGITKEYEFPKYFYYTVNSKKHGVVQKRTRTDSAMFKRFMKNKSKKEQAKAQGIFKITDNPIKIKIDLPSSQLNTKTKKKINKIIGNVDMGDMGNIPNIIDIGNIKNYMNEDIHDFEYSKTLNDFFDDLIREKKAKVDSKKKKPNNFDLLGNVDMGLPQGYENEPKRITPQRNKSDYDIDNDIQQRRYKIKALEKKLNDASDIKTINSIMSEIRDLETSINMMNRVKESKLTGEKVYF
jgi:hypothetical protein